MDDDACAFGRAGGAAGQGCTCDSQPDGVGTTAGNENITIHYHTLKLGLFHLKS